MFYRFHFNFRFYLIRCFINSLAFVIREEEKNNNKKSVFNYNVQYGGSLYVGKRETKDLGEQE